MMKINGLIFVSVSLFLICKANAHAQNRPVQIVLGGNQLVELQNPTRLQNERAVQRFDFEKHPFIQNLEKSVGERRTWRTQSTQDQSIASCARQSVLRDMATNQRQVHSVESYAVLCASYPSSNETNRPFQGSYAIFPRERSKGTGAQQTKETLEVVNLVSSPFATELRAHFSGQQIPGQNSRALSAEEREIFAGQCSPADGFKSKACEMYKATCFDGSPYGQCPEHNICPSGKIPGRNLAEYFRSKYNLGSPSGTGLGMMAPGGGSSSSSTVGMMTPGGVPRSFGQSMSNDLAPLSGMIGALNACNVYGPQYPTPVQQSTPPRRLPPREQLNLENGLQLTPSEYETVSSEVDKSSIYLRFINRPTSCFSCPRGTTFTAPNLCKDRNGCDVLTEELRGGVCRVKNCEGFNAAFCADKKTCKDECQEALGMIRHDRCLLEKILVHSDAVKSNFGAWDRSFYVGANLSYNISRTLRMVGESLIRQNKFESTLSGLVSELRQLEASLELTEKTCSRGSGTCSQAFQQIQGLYDRVRVSACPPGQFFRPSGMMMMSSDTCSPVDCSECHNRSFEARRFSLADFRHPTCPAVFVRNAISQSNLLFWQNSENTTQACHENRNPRLCSQIQTSFTENDVIIFMRDVQKLPCAQDRSTPASAGTTTTVPTKSGRGLTD